MTVKQEESAVCPPDALEKRIQQAQLTKCQHRIADYFLKNRNRICRMTSLAIAQEVGVSDASVIRFSRAVGYTGFADLRESLYRSSPAWTSAATRPRSGWTSRSTNLEG